MIDWIKIDESSLQVVKEGGKLLFTGLASDIIYGKYVHEKIEGVRVEEFYYDSIYALNYFTHYANPNLPE